MGRRETTDAQKAFLESLIPKFLEAQRTRTTPDFVTKAFLDWAKQWPEEVQLNTAAAGDRQISEEEVKLLKERTRAEADVKRKKVSLTFSFSLVHSLI